MNDPAIEDGSSGDPGRPPSLTRTPNHHLEVRGPDEQGACIQLAARWAEMFAPPEGDDKRGTRERFRIALQYLDAVIHGIEPPRT